jgi:phosphoenolpyruvate carboxykinase (GTP)
LASCPTTKTWTSLDKQTWQGELEGVKEWFGKMGAKLPAKLATIRDDLAAKFA